MTIKKTSIVCSARKIEPRQLRRSSPEFTKNVRAMPSLFGATLPLLRIDRSPEHPIVFCHGLLGFDSVTIGPAIAPLEVTHWRGIKEVLQANGTEVLMTRVPATSSPIQRAKVLEQKIEETYPGRSVHLLGTSPRPTLGMRSHSFRS
jgi:triacylglycerol lipase